MKKYFLIVESLNYFVVQEIFVIPFLSNLQEIKKNIAIGVPKKH